jgi:hypothetical protein
MNTTVAPKKVAIRNCHVSGLIKSASTLCVRADMVLTDGSRLDPYVRTFCTAVKAVATTEELTIVSHEGFTDFELTGKTWDTASARRITTLICGKALELIPQRHGSKLDFVVHEISTSSQ